MARNEKSFRAIATSEHGRWHLRVGDVVQAVNQSLNGKKKASAICFHRFISSCDSEPRFPFPEWPRDHDRIRTFQVLRCIGGVTFTECKSRHFGFDFMSLEVVN